jgi:hypothetical protein
VASLNHIVSDDGIVLCGGVDDSDSRRMANGSLIGGEPCGECVSIAQGAAQRGEPMPFPMNPEELRRIDEARVVISMTTVPARNGTLAPTIASLLGQSKRPHDIRLYLSPGSEPVAGATNIPAIDYGPVTKLSAALDPTVPSDAIIVTADDDIVFHRDWLYTLVKHALRHENEAIGYAGWYAEVLINSGTFQRASGLTDVIEGFGGVAYRKHFFRPDVMHPPASMKWVDDVWISSYLRKAGIARRVIPGAEKMVDVSRSVSSGIHTRPNFKELNTQAAIEGFR